MSSASAGISRFIDKQVELRRRTLVVCNDGNAYAPVAIAHYLMVKRKMSPHNAIKSILKVSRNETPYREGAERRGTQRSSRERESGMLGREERSEEETRGVKRRAARRRKEEWRGERGEREE